MRWAASVLLNSPSPGWYLCPYPCTHRPKHELDKTHVLDISFLFKKKDEADGIKKVNFMRGPIQRERRGLVFPLQADKFNSLWILKFIENAMQGGAEE